MDEFFEYLKIIGIGAPSDAPRVLLNHTSQEVFEIATRCYSLTGGGRHQYLAKGFHFYCE